MDRPKPDELTKTENQMLLIRIILGLQPGHDPVECVRVLFSDGREAFENLRGPVCEFAHEWAPWRNERRA
jgi:hypothetical protein